MLGWHVVAALDGLAASNYRMEHGDTNHHLATICFSCQNYMGVIRCCYLLLLFYAAARLICAKYNRVVRWVLVSHHST